MSVTVSTFAVPASDIAAAVDPLMELGFEFAPARQVTTTLVDTFDGRLHRAGLRLELRRSDTLELVLSGEGIVPAHLAVSKVPRVLADLPHGPFRSRLAELTDVRALLPQIRVRMERSTGLWRDTTGKVVATAELNEGVHVPGRLRTAIGRPRSRSTKCSGTRSMLVAPARQLQEAGFELCELDTLARCAAGERASTSPASSATASVPLDPRMASIDGFRAVLANLGATISANWQGAVDQTDTKFLHDLRIAVRRTRTVLAAAKGVLPAAIVDRASEGFAWLAGATGTPRDLDVYLLEWSELHRSARRRGGGRADARARSPRSDVTPSRTTSSKRCFDQSAPLELITTWRAWLDEPLHDDETLPTTRTASARRSGRQANRPGPRDARRQGPDDRSRHTGRAGPRPAQGRQEAPLPDRVLRRSTARQAAKEVRAPTQGAAGEPRRAPGRRGAHRAVAGDHRRDSTDSESPADTLVAIGQLTERLDQTRLAARAEFAERFADYDSRATQRALDSMLERARAVDRARIVKVLATYSIKGGVGKTTSAVNLAHAAAASGSRVLLWDLDPQGAATFFVRVKPRVKGGVERLVGQGRVARGEHPRHR